MYIDPFGVEIWMNAYETRCTYNLAETCVHSLTVSDLLSLTGRNDAALSDLLPIKLTYGAIPGSDRLRDAIASALYETKTRDDILVTHGTAGANALVWQALIGPGDRVVSLVPTYQQHVSIPEALGADVTRLPLCSKDWMPDLDALRAVARGAKMIALTNPNNPTGAVIGADMMAEIVAIARAADAWLLVDEVYRGRLVPSVADLYEKGIATCGMSKMFALAGLRLGWVTGPADVLEAVSHHRDYTTISVGQVDDHLATLALEACDRVLARSHDILQANLAVLSAWVDREPRVTWVPPRAGTVALLRYDVDLPSEPFCRDLLSETGVLLTPGAVMGVEGTVRIGFGNTAEELREGLPLISSFLDKKAGACRPTHQG
ncbi:MAG: aminotransferase class I/II-fold pyridoxal phosphate-dependent enzyme [Pseudomonadota bacterium]